MSTCGAAITTSWPVAATAAASACSPGASIPSSLVMRMRTPLRPLPVALLLGGAPDRLACGARVLGQPARAHVAHALTDVHGVIGDALVEPADEGELHGNLQGQRARLVRLEHR